MKGGVLFLVGENHPPADDETTDRHICPSLDQGTRGDVYQFGGLTGIHIIHADQSSDNISSRGLRHFMYVETLLHIFLSYSPPLFTL